MKVIERFGRFILRSQLHAGILALVFAVAPILGIPFLGWLSIIIVGLVTLRKGAVEGFIVLIWSAVPAIVMAFMSTEMFLLSQVLFGGIVVWFFSLLLRAQYAWAQLLEIMAWIGIVIVLLVHGGFDNIYAWWTAKLHALFSQYNSVSGGDDVAQALSAQHIYYLTHVATGFFISMISLNAVFNLIIARWWQASIFNPGGLKHEFLMIRLSYRLTIALLIAIVLAFFRVAWSFDLLPVLLVVFFVAGFSLMNAWLVRMKNGWIWMLLFYVLLVLRFIFISAAVMMVAIIDSIFDIRKRWIKKIAR